MLSSASRLRGASLAVTLALLIAGVGAGAALAAPDAPAAEGTAVGAPGATGTELPKVDLNTATEEQLITLPRIGPVVARRIVEYRRSVRAFQTVDELLNVRGIGERTLDLLRPRLLVSKPQAEPAPSVARDAS